MSALRRDVPDALPVPDAVLRLDATTLSGLADGDAVSEWSDADGRGWTFNNPAEVYPTYSSDAMNGRPALWFGALTQTRLLCAATFQTRTIFAAYRASSGSHNWGCAGFFGYANNDRGLRFDNNSAWSTSGWNNKAVSFGINGVSGVRTFKNNEAAVVSAEYDSAHAAGTYAVGDYWADTRYNRFYYGWIGELIVYDRVLTDDEKAQVNDYLMKKWGVKEYETPPAMTNVLPETTALTVSGEGVLDLAGGSPNCASRARRRTRSRVGSSATSRSRSWAVRQSTSAAPRCRRRRLPEPAASRTARWRSPRSSRAAWAPRAR